jgi:hypothetical protein
MALKKIGALWLKEKNGKKYFSGQIEPDGREGRKLPILIFKNDKKEKDNQPDYTINLRTDDDRKDDRKEGTDGQRTAGDDGAEHPF